ncbi:MAG TPA: dihydrodipicolinate synthase family protein [Acidimicrobiia bacterium]|nr:dihydrodipicolinate synthase family protein [Acidimicrobiia bacterium]
MRTPPRLMPAIVSPFDDAGELDLDAHRHNVSLLAGRGVEGFVIGGSNGEGPYLEPGERARLTRVTLETAPDAFVLVGIVAESLRSTMGLVAEVSDTGADAVLVTTPTTLVRRQPAMVERYYEDIAASSALPVFLYSVPRVTAYDLAIDSATRLAEHPNVVGIKDSSGDLDRARALVATSLTVFVGSSAIAWPAVAAGAHGAITASANYAPELAAAVVALALTGEETPLQAVLTAVSGAIERHGVGAVKYAATRAGLRGGSPRRPLESPDDETRALIDAALDEASRAPG